MISIEKPGSPSEVLEQSGVKGMKWGVRKIGQASRDFGSEFPTGKSRAHEIRRARAEQRGRQDKFVAAPRGSAKRAKLKKAYLNNPDRVTSLRMTRGEKVVTGLLIGTAPVFGLVALPATAAGVAGTAYTMRKIRERRMAEGR